MALGDEFPGNSETEKLAKRKTVKEESKSRPKLESVVTKPVVTKKKGLLRRAADNFLSEEVGDIKDYIVQDVLIPSMKNVGLDMVRAVCDALQGSVETAFYGRRVTRPGQGIASMITRAGSRTYVGYSNISTANAQAHISSREERSARARHDFSEIVYSSRGEAEEVLSHLVDLTIDYGLASVADYRELSGLETSGVDQNYGWTNLKDAYTERVSNGYIIKLPVARPL